MSVTASSAPATRRPRTSGADTGGGRSGAALRAYERRQQRTAVHGGDATGHGSELSRGSLSAGALTARIPFVALIIGLLSLGLGLTLLLTTRAAEDSYSLSDAKAYNERLVQERASLQRDVELADSAPELARKAAEQGMVPALNAARLLVADDGSVQVIGTPEAAQGTPVAPLDPPETSTPTPARSSSGTTSSTAVADTTRAASSASSVTRATPSTANDAGTEALGEQLVPMSIGSESPSGSGQ